jgi:hypothetical protein
MASAETDTSTYKVWIHESGVDAIDGAAIYPIDSYFVTCDISLITLRGVNKKVRIAAIEPDFVQTGPMTVQIVGRANARAPDVDSVEFPIPEVASIPSEQIISLKEQRRQLRVKFRSNVIGGDYQMGLIIGHMEPGDGTMVGG